MHNMIIHERVLEKLEESGVLVFSHTATYFGYVSRKNGSLVEADYYKGKYGTGLKVYRPNRNSTRYSLLDYYLLTDDYSMSDLKELLAGESIFL